MHIQTVRVTSCDILIIRPGSHECGESGRAIGRVQAFPVVAFKVQVYDFFSQGGGINHHPFVAKSLSRSVPPLAKPVSYQECVRLITVQFPLSCRVGSPASGFNGPGGVPLPEETRNDALCEMVGRYSRWLVDVRENEDAELLSRTARAWFMPALAERLGKGPGEGEVSVCLACLVLFHYDSRRQWDYSECAVPILQRNSDRCAVGYELHSSSRLSHHQ